MRRLSPGARAYLLRRIAEYNENGLAWREALVGLGPVPDRLVLIGRPPPTRVERPPRRRRPC